MAWSADGSFDEEDRRQLKAVGIDPIPLFEELVATEDQHARERPATLLNLVADEIIQIIDEHVPEEP